MAEIFVFAVPHSMELISQTEKEKWDIKTKRKFDARYQMGDIYEVYPDGYTDKFGDGPIKNPIFAVIRLPGLKVEDLKQYTQSVVLKDISKDDILKYRRKYGIPVSMIPQPMQIVTLKDAAQTELISSIIDKDK